jgi:hypothetical protein
MGIEFRQSYPKSRRPYTLCPCPADATRQARTKQLRACLGIAIRDIERESGRWAKATRTGALKLKGLLEIAQRIHTMARHSFLDMVDCTGKPFWNGVIGSEAICAIGLPSNKVLEMLVAKRWLERIFYAEKRIVIF